MSTVEHHVLEEDGTFPMRRVRVYLPSTYTQRGGDRFPLLVLQDGQNMFDAGSDVMPSWGADTALDALAARNAIEPWVAIGIEHRAELRIGDYAPFVDSQHCHDARGHRYVEELTHRILPWVRANYRVRAGADATAIGGSSLGGLVALYAGSVAREHFGRVAALSPTSMWAGDRIVTQLRNRPCGRLYVDAGEHEHIQIPGGALHYGQAVRRLADVLHATMEPSRLRVVIDPHGSHDEQAWRRRLPAALEWLLV